MDADEKRVWNGGERQASPTLAGIRADHLARYRFACDYIRAGMTVVDAACGIGYGAQIMAVRGGVVKAIDISADALRYGAKHYAHERVEFIQSGVHDLPFDNSSADLFVSFETVEHVDDLDLLVEARRVLKPGALLLCSTPNEERLPFNKAGFEHHLRHYKPAEFEALLTGVGFSIEAKFSNTDQYSSELAPNWNGPFNIAVARKPKE